MEARQWTWGRNGPHARKSTSARESRSARERGRGRARIPRDREPKNGLSENLVPAVLAPKRVLEPPKSIEWGPASRLLWPKRETARTICLLPSGESPIDVEWMAIDSRFGIRLAAGLGRPPRAGKLAPKDPGPAFEQGLRIALNSPLALEPWGERSAMGSPARSMAGSPHQRNDRLVAESASKGQGRKPVAPADSRREFPLETAPDIERSRFDAHRSPARQSIRNQEQGLPGWLLLAVGWLFATTTLEAVRVAEPTTDLPPRPATDPAYSSARELRRLPGIGPARSAAIVEWRWAHGTDGFRLSDVPGIGEFTEAKALEALAAQRAPAPSAPD